MKQLPRFLQHLAPFSLLALAGCATTPVTVQVPVPVPVECREVVPERPVMPTEQFATEPTLDQFTQAAQAELLRREGYEKRLVAALLVCTAPVGD